jgi:hypothetical protein
VSVHFSGWEILDLVQRLLSHYRSPFNLAKLVIGAIGAVSVVVIVTGHHSSPQPFWWGVVALVALSIALDLAAYLAHRSSRRSD